MVAKAKIAVSLSKETLALVDRHAAGRSRSQAIEEELRRALRAREWERLSSELIPDDVAEQLAWAEASLSTVPREPPRARRPRARR